MFTAVRKPVLKVLVGSHNYNLNEEDSDKDYKLFVMPTFEDLYHGKQYSKQHVGEAEDWDIHDIRKLPNLIWKANLNFLEVLYSKDTQILTANPKVYQGVSWILDKRDELVKMNLPYLYSACIGMFYNKMKYIEQNKATEGTQHLFDKWGYDTKQALHAYRILDFLERFYQTDFSNFQKAMWYEGQARNALLEFKHGKYKKDYFIELANEKLLRARELEGNYQHSPNHKLKGELDEVLMYIVKEGIVSGGSDTEA